MSKFRRRFDCKSHSTQEIQSAKPGRIQYVWILPAFLLTVVGLPSENLKAEVHPVVAKVQQSSKFKGNISDAGGEPLPGATVQIKGGTKGVIADMDGNLTIALLTVPWWFRLSVWSPKKYSIPVSHF